MVAQTKCLAVDDHPAVRQGLALLLAGADDIDLVESVDSGEAVLEAIERYSPSVVIVDVRLPGIDGISAVKRIAERAPDVKTVSGRIVTTGGNGTVVLSASQQQAVFVATDLPDLPAGRIYEAWTIDGTPVPAATFSAQDAKTAVTLPPAAFDASSVAITIEPAGGSEAPTTKPIFTVSVPQQS